MCLILTCGEAVRSWNGESCCSITVIDLCYGILRLHNFTLGWDP